MRTIRKSVFETNSSAMHSIVISKEKEFNYQLFPSKEMNGIKMEFYQEQNDYYDTLSKIQYLLNIFESDIEWAIKYYESYYNKKMILSIKDMKDYLFEFLKSKNIIFKEPKEYGYTAANGIQTLKFLNWLFSSDERLEAFLFNSKSYIHTTADWDDQYWDEECPKPNKIHNVFQVR